MGSGATNDAGLAARFRDGDPDAVRDAYRRYGRSVYGVALRSLGNPTLADEVVQQTFVQAWRAAATVDGSRELGPWLFTIARRVAIDLYRREARRSHDDVGAVADGDPAVVTLPVAPERLALTWEVRAAVDDLPVDEREVVRLQHFAGLTHNEIADRLALPVGTVKSRSFRAHRRLAAGLQHWRRGEEAR